MRLGELITFLEGVDPNLVVPKGFHNPHSYRGSYNQLAFEPCKNTSFGDMLEVARQALNQTYTGWKGGEYKMDQYTEC